MAKKRNPTDATMRNVRAAVKRNKSLATRVATLERYVKYLDTRLVEVESILLNSAIQLTQQGATVTVKVPKRFAKK